MGSLFTSLGIGAIGLMVFLVSYMVMRGARGAVEAFTNPKKLTTARLAEEREEQVDAEYNDKRRELNTRRDQLEADKRTAAERETRKEQWGREEKIWTSAAKDTGGEVKTLDEIVKSTVGGPSSTPNPISARDPDGLARLGLPTRGAGTGRATPGSPHATPPTPKPRTSSP